jgi:hypothetical protein
MFLIRGKSAAENFHQSTKKLLKINSILIKLIEFGGREEETLPIKTANDL